MMKLTIKGDKMFTYKGVNYTGGQQIELPDSVAVRHSKMFIEEPKAQKPEEPKKTKTKVKED